MKYLIFNHGPRIVISEIPIPNHKPIAGDLKALFGNKFLRYRNLMNVTSLDGHIMHLGLEVSDEAKIELIKANPAAWGIGDSRFQIHETLPKGYSLKIINGKHYITGKAAAVIPKITTPTKTDFVTERHDTRYKVLEDPHELVSKINSLEEKQRQLSEEEEAKTIAELEITNVEDIDIKSFNSEAGAAETGKTDINTFLNNAEVFEDEIAPPMQPEVEEEVLAQIPVVAAEAPEVEVKTSEARKSAIDDLLNFDDEDIEVEEEVEEEEEEDEEEDEVEDIEAKTKPAVKAKPAAKKKPAKKAKKKNKSKRKK